MKIHDQVKDAAKTAIEKLIEQGAPITEGVVEVKVSLFTAEGEMSPEDPKPGRQTCHDVSVSIIQLEDSNWQVDDIIYHHREFIQGAVGSPGLKVVDDEKSLLTS